MRQVLLRTPCAHNTTQHTCSSDRRPASNEGVTFALWCATRWEIWPWDAAAAAAACNKLHWFNQCHSVGVCVVRMQPHLGSEPAGAAAGPSAPSACMTGTSCSTTPLSAAAACSPAPSAAAADPSADSLLAAMAPDTAPRHLAVGGAAAAAALGDNGSGTSLPTMRAQGCTIGLAGFAVLSSPVTLLLRQPTEEPWPPDARPLAAAGPSGSLLSEEPCCWAVLASAVTDARPATAAA